MKNSKIILTICIALLVCVLPVFAVEVSTGAALKGEIDQTFSTSTTITIKDNVTLTSVSRTYLKNGCEVVIDGKGHTITANTGNNVISDDKYGVFDVYSHEDLTETAKITLKDMTIIVKEGFRYGLNFCSTHGTMDVVLENVHIIMQHSKDVIKSGKVKECVAIENVGANITFKGNCSIETDKTCWAAIDTDNQHDTTTSISKLTFATGSSMAFIDNRTDAKKCTEPIIKFTDSKGSISKIDNAIDVKSNTVSALFERQDGQTSDSPAKKYYGYKLKGQHTHGNWSYGVIDNSIFAECGVDGCTLPESRAYISVFAPGEAKLTTYTEPMAASAGTVTWKSSNPSVATVDANGVVKAVSAGTTKITATSVRGEKLSDSIEITVQ